MEFINNIKLLWQYAKEQKWYIFGYIFANVLIVIGGIVVPILSAKQIVNITNSAFEQIITISVVLFLLESLRNGINYVVSYCAQKTYRKTLLNIQYALGQDILKLTNNSIDSNSSGVFIQRLTGDVSRLSDMFNVLNMFASQIFLDIGIFFTIFFINKVVFLYIAIMTIATSILEVSRTRAVNREDKTFRDKSEKTTGFVGELVRGLRDIKMLNAEDSFMNEFYLRLVNLNEAKYKMNRVNRSYRFYCGEARDIYDFGLMILMVYLMSKELLSVAMAIVILNYSGRVLSIVNSFGSLMEYIKDFNLSSSRVFSIMDEKEFPKENFGDVHLEKVKGNFEFKNVKFSYGEGKVLNGVSFKIAANETVAFVGKSGAGKTTIFNLLCKMYEVNSGKIMIDGIDIKKLDRESIRGNITIISQNPYIFNMSIRDNLRLVKADLSFEEMKHACHLACLDDFIESLPDGYDTVIGEGGVNLSGGEKQRLAIARALVQKTEIILFDEATSALDNETQRSIQRAIENMKNEYTILIIAHRLSTIINSDRIVFLNNGIIEAEGTHKELLKKCPDYKKLYEAEKC